MSVTEAPSGPPGSVDGLTGAYSSSHTYATPSVYQLTATVTDDDGGPGSAAGQVEVLSPAAAGCPGW